MSAPHLHLTAFEGGAALSAFRTSALLARLQQVEPSITGVQARHVHWVASDEMPDAALLQLLQALLDSTPAAPTVDLPPGHALLVVMPRLGTVSPWSSKATDIARNCA
jgi:phosphoribosylformylglycinamidine synthase